MNERVLPLDVETLTARIAALIRQYIIEMHPGFAPGSRLNPRNLAREFGVSETPMKQALQELATHGLVEIFPRRGTFVGKLSRRDIHELIELRTGLEAMALRIAALKLDEVLSDMLGCVHLCEEALEGGDSEKYRSNDARFHRLIVQASGNRRLDEVYESLTGSVQILNVYNPRHRAQQLESQAEHRLLVGVFRDGDIDRSVQALAEHWRKSERRLTEAYSPFLVAADQPV
jgi:DNA-binding GntR family transcriptional regulator